MGIFDSIVRPRPKRENILPYTFEARVDILAGHGSEPEFYRFYSGRICGLIAHLDFLGLAPGEVELFSVFRDRQVPLAAELFTTAEGNWLKRPQLCRALERYFRETGNDCFRGHWEEGLCAFADRDGDCFGPAV